MLELELQIITENIVVALVVVLIRILDTTDFIIVDPIGSVAVIADLTTVAIVDIVVVVGIDFDFINHHLNLDRSRFG
jgi:hypothetical protein